MKLFILLMVATFPFSSGIAAKKGGTTCRQILERATPATGKGKKKAPGCVLVEHTIGINPGSTESVYSCGNTRYTLLRLANDDCSVTIAK